ncbi:MAG: hypothetical protein AAGK04_04740 [Planctomycetota bacterium]
MRAYIDDTELTLDRPSQRAAFEGAIRAAEAEGRIVIEALRDGETVSPDDLAELPDDPGSAGELRFRSANPRTLVRVTLDEVGDALEQLGPVQRALGEQIQAGETDGLADGLRDVVEVWQATRQSVDHARMLLGDGLGEAAATQLETALPPLAESLTELHRSLTAQDWSGVGDVLLEDLTPQAEVWLGLLRELSSGLAGE